MATTIMRPMQTAASHFLLLLLSFFFLVMACPSAYAFAFHNSLQRVSNIHPLTYYRRGSSRSSDTSVAYTSTPFDVDNTNDLWQLLQELHHNNRNDKQNSPSNNEAFQRVIQALCRESKLNVHNLEKEIEILRQKLDAPISADDGSCNNGSFQSKTMHNNNDSNRQNDGSNNMDVDEISNKLLKAVFVGYTWTEEDRKRLQSANPQDRHC
eukprot:CAMPEP_0201698214 /NCGR_PEP_ID=MMETSP0578-20130828/17778_1 /ASSEMBLY_ACC=CAM_ASM_000663 /TAXON_ID=267565 /ORGANISM="Skeletonema grethea, Strain CCMP 1804" /LENGTH=209 /DNA_ID=CAMNT_0048184683 /DNA_START=55 /DNA_END=684 /DNA_ORIENTATION=-